MVQGGVLFNGCGGAHFSTFSNPVALVWIGLCGVPPITRVGQIAKDISHEIRHTLNLVHYGDSSFPPGTTRNYLFDVPTTADNVVPLATWPANRRWQTIMGGTSTSGVSQWSNGNYPNAIRLNPPTNPFQDNLAVIGASIPRRPNTACNQVGV